MVSRSTRNKVRFQGKSALEDLRKAQDHLGQLAALADDRSQFIDNNLPQIMAFLEMVTQSVEKLYNRL